MATKAVVFDLWNTLAYNRGTKKNPVLLLEEKLGLNMSLYREIEQGFMMQEFPSKKEAMVNLCRHIGLKPKPMLIETLVDVWDNMQINVTLFPDVEPALRELRKTHRLALLSNTDCFSIKEFRERGIDKLFDFVGFSCEMGMLKPSEKFFMAALNEIGVRPEESVMVGDNMKDDIMAAEKLGMKGVLIKRDFASFDAKPSHIESIEHKHTISTLNELKRYL